MSADTEAYLRSLETTTHFAFEGALPFGENAGAAMDRLLGRPVVNQDGMASIAASAKVIVVGDWSHYFLCEHGNIEVTRNPYLYQANGQVGIFSKKRWGGAPVQTEAFVVMRQSA
jgi:HK97 family phage major capsid protein